MIDTVKSVTVIASSLSFLTVMLLFIIRFIKKTI